MRPLFAARALSALILLTPLTACPGPRPGPADPPSRGEVLDPEHESPGTIRRSFECLKRDADGNCLANKCTQGPGGATFDCGSFAKACIDADLHWSGTKEGGTCSVPL